MIPGDVKMRRAQRAFDIATSQVRVLNRRIMDAEKRYTKSKKLKLRSLRDSFKYSLEITKGVRHVFFNIAMKKADEILELEEEHWRQWELDSSAVTEDSFDRTADDNDTSGSSEDNEINRTVWSMNCINTYCFAYL